MLDLQPIKSRLAATTPGRWYREVTGVAHRGIRTEKTWLFADDGATEADAKLVANAPADLAVLVAEVERLRGELDDAEARIDWRGAGMTLDLGAIKARLAAATPGTWTLEPTVGIPNWSGTCLVLTNQEDGSRARLIGTISTENDARMVAYAPGDIAELVAGVERLRAAIEAHRKGLLRSGPEAGLDVTEADRDLWAVLDAQA